MKVKIHRSMIKQRNESDYNLQNTMSFYFYFYFLCFPETEDIVTLYDDDDKSH